MKRDTATHSHSQRRSPSPLAKFRSLASFTFSSSVCSLVTAAVGDRQARRCSREAGDMRNVGQEFSCGIDHMQGRGHVQRREIGDVRQQSPYSCVDQRMSSQARTAVDDAVTNRRGSGHLAEEVPQFRRRSRPRGLRGVSIRHPFTVRREQSDVKARRASIEDQCVTITALVGSVSTHHTPPVHSVRRHGAPATECDPVLRVGLGADRVVLRPARQVDEEDADVPVAVLQAGADVSATSDTSTCSFAARGAVGLRLPADALAVQWRGSSSSPEARSRADSEGRPRVGARTGRDFRRSCPRRVASSPLSCRLVGLGDVAPRRFPQAATTGRDPLVHPLGSTPRLRDGAPLAC